MELEEAIKTRRSVRSYEDRDVPLELVMRAISLAGWAPNGGNFQPWKFFVVKNREMINRMADAVQAKNDLMATWPEAAEFGDTFERYRRHAAFFRTAPVVIAVTMGAYSSPADRVLRRRGPADPAAAEMLRNRAEISSRIQTIGGSIAYLLLVVHSLGLGACWMAGPMLAREELERMLEVPEDLELFALVPVGYPARVPEPGARKPLEEIVRVIE
jgi:nitroreductase